MNTRDLQYFAMLVKLKNYTQVAKYFNVSQPSITQAIRRAVGSYYMKKRWR